MMDYQGIVTMLKGWAVVVLFTLLLSYVYVNSNTAELTFSPDVDYTQEIQEAIDKVGKEIANPPIKKSPWRGQTWNGSRWVYTE